MRETSNPRRPFLIFFTLSGLFVLSMFYRVSSAVIAPNLIQDLGLSAETLGILGGAYFYSFAILQIPVGPMLDRIGPRIIISSFSLIGAVGAILFALGESFTAVLLGRILIGVGMSPVLMGAMKVFVLRFPAGKFATLVGLLLSVGTLGNISATSPLAFLTTTIGWRTTFILAGGVTALFSLLVFWVLGGEKKEAEPISPSGPEIGVLQSMRMIFKSLVFWQMGTVAFFRYGTFVGLQGLWLGPYLMDIRGYTPVQTGNLLILLAIGTIVGGPIAGRLSDRFPGLRKGVALLGLGLYALSLFPLTGALNIEAYFWYGLIFLLIGFFCSFGMQIYSHAKDLYPVAISGTTMTLVNFFTMAGAAIFMPAMGKVIESFPRTNHAYPAEAYHLSFIICFLGMAASVIFYAFSKKD
ncbi:MAG: MFS transporter [Deltaproteobacteria bacterium]|nr:MFS transporter [Deltaproteobacteria bacterium]